MAYDFYEEDLKRAGLNATQTGQEEQGVRQSHGGGAVSNKLAQKAMAGDTPSMIWFEKTRRGMKDTQKVETVQTVKRINLTGTDENSKPKRPQK
jgi:hypothetical protein